MDLPREAQVKYGIEAGAVFLIEKEGDKNEHFFVVLNLDPKKDIAIILVFASTLHTRDASYITEVERRFGAGTVVRISDGESTVIKKDSTFNCNVIKDPTLDELCNSVDYKRIKRIGRIESVILGKLRIATLLSPRLKKKYQKCLKDPIH